MEYKDKWENIPISHKKDILKGLQDVENGKLVDHEEVWQKLFGIPAKVTACKCLQCRGKKRETRNRKTVRFFKRQTNKMRRKRKNKRIHFMWA